MSEMDSIVAGVGRMVVSKSASFTVETDIKVEVGAETEVAKKDTKSTVGEKECSADGADKENQLLEVVQNFLTPLKEGILRAKAEMDGGNSSQSMSCPRPVPPKLLKSLCNFIWEPDMVYANKGVLLRVYKLMNYHFRIQEGQSDLDDFLEHKPSEALAYKATQVFIALVLPDPKLFANEMKNFKQLITDNRVARDGRAEAAYLFLYNTFQTLFIILSGESTDEEISIPDFFSLDLPSRCVIQTLSVIFIRQFRLKSKERVDRIRQVVQDDSSSLEWCIYLAEILRLKRRESVTGRAQWATQEELELIATAVSIDPQNPFVRLSVIDTVIGCVRDANGRFHCGDIHLDNLDDAMRYLHSASQKLVTEFPKNVMFNSVISDYFARYVPMLYFDEEYSLNLLMIAYNLNPFQPKTTHRLGILHRMSLKNIDESLKWFEKTIQLDPYHFQATMEYFKTIMGKADKYDVVVLMKQTLESPASKGWSPLEMAEFNFYFGLAHFIKGEKNETLSLWTKVAKINEYPLTLIELQDTFLFYEWDSQLVSSDKLRLWIKEEKDSISAKEKAKEYVDPVRTKFINRLFAFMLGRARPFRSSVLNHAYVERFPSQYLGQFSDV